jgi:hypothetical protein
MMETQEGIVLVLLVIARFYSGWNKVMSIWQIDGQLPGPVAENPTKDLRR